MATKPIINFTTVIIDYLFNGHSEIELKEVHLATKTLGFSQYLCKELNQCFNINSTYTPIDNFIWAIQISSDDLKVIINKLQCVSKKVLSGDEIKIVMSRYIGDLVEANFEEVVSLRYKNEIMERELADLKIKYRDLLLQKQADLLCELKK